MLSLVRLQSRLQMTSTPSPAARRLCLLQHLQHLDSIRHMQPQSLQQQQYPLFKASVHSQGIHLRLWSFLPFVLRVDQLLHQLLRRLQLLDPRQLLRRLRLLDLRLHSNLLGETSRLLRPTRLTLQLVRRLHPQLLRQISLQPHLLRLHNLHSTRMSRLSSMPSTLSLSTSLRWLRSSSWILTASGCNKTLNPRSGSRRWTLEAPISSSTSRRTLQDQLCLILGGEEFLTWSMAWDIQELSALDSPSPIGSFGLQSDLMHLDGLVNASLVNAPRLLAMSCLPSANSLCLRRDSSISTWTWSRFLFRMGTSTYSRSWTAFQDGLRPYPSST